MPKPTLAQRKSFKTWIRKYRDKFANTTIPEFYIDDILSSTSVGIATTNPVRIVPFGNFETVDITNDETNETLFYLPAHPGDEVTVGFGATSVTLKMVGDDQGVTKDGTTYTLDQNIPLQRGRALTIKGLGGALLQSTTVPIYDVTPSLPNIDEGLSIDFTINTTDVPIGTTLYYNTEQGSTGTSASGSDLISPNSGSFTIASDGGAGNTGIATVTRTITLDGVTEGPETFRFVVLTDSTTVGVVTRTDDIIINDIIPSYSVGILTTSITEGSSVEFTVNTSGISSGTILYFSTNGTVSASDFTDNSLTGSFQIVGIGTTSVGVATFQRGLVAESSNSNEGDETFNLVIRTGSTSGTAVTTSPTITVKDTFPTYNLVLQNNAGIATDIAEENELLTGIINTTQIANDTQLTVYFEEVPGTGSDRNYRDIGRFTTQPSSGAFNINTTGDSTTFNFMAEYDWRANENDQFRVIVREYGSGSSGTALTSKDISITDVDLLFDLTVDKTVVNEGEPLTFTFGNVRHPVTGINTYMPRGPVYMTIETVSGNITNVSTGGDLTKDFDYPWYNLRNKVQTGNYSGYGNESTWTITPTADFAEDGVDVFYVAARGHAYDDPIIARSPDITIRDSSLPPGSKADGLTFGPVKVNRDDGVVADLTDWFKICDIDSLPSGSSIALFIDDSGSMRLSNVQASYDLLLQKCNEKGITITTVTNSDEDWITPFLVDLP